MPTGCFPAATRLCSRIPQQLESFSSFDSFVQKNG
jgi:hypothetical protein